MSDVAIEIERIAHIPEPEDPIGHFMVKQVTGNRLGLIGWALGIRTPVQAVEVVVDGSVIASAATEIPRPDVEEQFPTVPGSAVCGFRVAIEAQGQGRSELDVQMVRGDGSRVSIGQLFVVAKPSGVDD
jgi:hypothetical protein